MNTYVNLYNDNFRTNNNLLAPFEPLLHVKWKQYGKNCFQFVYILQHSSFGFTSKKSRKNILSDHFVVSATCREMTCTTSRLNHILYYLTLGNPEILSLDKEADKASKWWVCILDWISEITLSLLAHTLVQTSTSICQRKYLLLATC